MDIRPFLPNPEEKPLDRLVCDGGFCGIFRTIGCIGDSLSSGEFEVRNDRGEVSYHDFYDYSWGQFLGRMAGSKVYNFSRGGMSAREYLDSFSEENGFWDKALACQAYILALGVNDLFNCGATLTEFEQDYREIVARYQTISPNAKFFFVTMPRGFDTPEGLVTKQDHAGILHQIAADTPNCYVIDLFRYAPEYDQAFHDAFYLGGHMNPTGYLLTARMIASYMDYLIRNHPADFRKAGLIGSDLHNSTKEYPDI